MLGITCLDAEIEALRIKAARSQLTPLQLLLSTGRSLVPVRCEKAPKVVECMSSKLFAVNYLTYEPIFIVPRMALA